MCSGFLHLDWSKIKACAFPRGDIRTSTESASKQPYKERKDGILRVKIPRMVPPVLLQNERLLNRYDRQPSLRNSLTLNISNSHNCSLELRILHLIPGTVSLYIANWTLHQNSINNLILGVKKA